MPFRGISENDRSFRRPPTLLEMTTRRFVLDLAKKEPSLFHSSLPGPGSISHDSTAILAHAGLHGEYLREMHSNIKKTAYEVSSHRQHLCSRGYKKHSDKIPKIRYEHGEPSQKTFLQDFGLNH